MVWLAGRHGQEAPYRPPARLDFGRIEFLLSARTSTSEDQYVSPLGHDAHWTHTDSVHSLWALREDPIHFSDHLLTYKEHRQEMIKDSDGNSHPVLQGDNINVFWERVIGNVLRRAHAELEMFSELRRQAETLRGLHARYEATLSPLQGLPEDFLVAILHFRFFITEFAKDWLYDSRQACSAAPPMRSMFVREAAKDLN
jgi:hypothetical protein